MEFEPSVEKDGNGDKCGDMLEEPPRCISFPRDIPNKSRADTWRVESFCSR